PDAHYALRASPATRLPTHTPFPYTTLFRSHHYAVGYHLDGRQAFVTQVNERCHDVVPHPYLPLAVFVGRRPSRESYLIDTRDGTDRKSTRLNSSHVKISYAVFCLKKKNT